MLKNMSVFIAKKIACVNVEFYSIFYLLIRIIKINQIFVITEDVERNYRSTDIK